MKEHLISVIVPVYNVEKELNTCIDSILRQSYKHIEVILVDDGSTDASAGICDDYAHGDSRVKVIHQDNNGVGMARNAGLDLVIGDYIAFVDSDDWVEPDFLESLYKTAIENNVKMVACNYKIHTPEGVHCYTEARTDRRFNAEEAIASMWYGEEMDTNVWTRLYHRDIWSEIRFPDTFCEDLAVLHRLVAVAGGCLYLGTALYHYRVREVSETRSFSKRKFVMLDIADDIIKYAQESEMDIINPARNKAVDAYFHVICRLNNKKQYWLECQRCQIFVERHRKAVLKDKRARKKTKYALLLSYFGLGVVRFVFRRQMR